MLEINNLHDLEKRIKEELIPKITKQMSEEELLIMLNDFFSKEVELKVQMDLSFLNKIDRTGKSNYLKLILEADKIDKLLIIKQNLKPKKQKKEVSTSIFSSKKHTNVNLNVDTEEMDEIYGDDYLELPEDMIKMQIQKSNNEEEEEEKMELLMDLIRKGNPKDIERFLNNNPELKAKYPSIEMKIKKEIELESTLNQNNKKVPKEYKEEENNLYPSPNIGSKH